jgi:molecular chaperone Hsp33
VSDRSVRAMTNDHGFRVIAACTTDSAREVIARQKVSGELARALAELVTAAVLLRETMAPDIRVQGLLHSVTATSRAQLVGDSFPDGTVRGLAQVKGDRSGFALATGTTMKMMRSLANGMLQQGIVDVGSAGGVGVALGTYLAESEQLACVARTGAVFESGELVRSGGFIVQLLPEVERPQHLIMTQRLEDFPPIEKFLAEASFSAEGLLEELLYGMPNTELGRQELRFGCRCDETLVLGALATLGKDDLQSMVDDGEGLEIDCDYCGKHYGIAIERLRALLQAS